MATKPRARPQHRTRVIYQEDGDDTATSVDARSLTLPGITIISVVCSCIYLTYTITGTLTQERTRLDKRIDTVVSTVERLAVSISQLADGIRIGTQDRYTKVDHELFCAKAELVNKSFKCPEDRDVTSNNTTRMRGKLDDVDREMSVVTDKLKNIKELGDK